jgi:hypothetical protein
MNWIKLGKKELEYYGDLLIMADTGLHSQVFPLLMMQKIK